jgi:hypothetical protein
MNRAACTIISYNYLPYARTLCESFLAAHPECSFYVLLVDRVPDAFNPSREQFELVTLDELAIPDFPSVAFKYDILELNTNVKPTFLKLLLARGADEVVYLDPDILVCNPLAPVFDSLADHDIVLTPHALSPNDGPAEIILLSAGVFNLGFVALSKSPEACRFLDWWEARCLDFAYDERRSGMFVDQKWANLVPCFFDRVMILKHAGFNVAYWNLHERHLSGPSGAWIVNKSRPLIFFHFSGVLVDGGDRISKYTDRFTLHDRPDLRLIVEDYRSRLIRHGIRDKMAEKYAFGSFDNGQPINRLTRSLYSASLERFAGENPFSSKSYFYKVAEDAGVFSFADTANTYTSKSYSKDDPRARAIHGALRMALRMLGANRYTALLKYLSHISILRNQADVLL